MTLSDLGTPLVIHGGLTARKARAYRAVFAIQFAREDAPKLKSIALAAIAGLFIGATLASLRTPNGSAIAAVEIVNAASIRGNYVARRSMARDNGAAAALLNAQTQVARKSFLDGADEISRLKTRNRRLEALVTVLQQRAASRPSEDEGSYRATESQRRGR